MTTHNLTITRATEADLDGILQLQAENQLDHGGALASSLSPARILAMLLAMPVIVARDGDEIIGFLLTAARDMNDDYPLVKAMLEAYRASEDTYIYGPICVTEHERGHGLAQLMFDELCRLEPDREGILFVGKNNEASMHAHQKMGMREVASFIHDESEFAVFSFRGKPAVPADRKSVV